MKKWLIVGILGAVAMVVVLKKTNVCSYAGTLFNQISAEAKGQVPAKFELERIRNEIAALDGDISQMIRPIAEYKTAIVELRKNITRSEASIADKKKNLLRVVEDLKGDPKFVIINEKQFSAETVRRQLARDTEDLKRLEKNVKAQVQVLEAKELALKATQEQLAKVITKKREYEVRLAQLEAEEETLRVASIGTEFKFDNSRATQIEEALAAVEHGQSVRKHEIEMKTGELANLNLHEPRVAPSDLNTIRNYLEGNEPAEKAASNK